MTVVQCEIRNPVRTLVGEDVAGEDVIDFVYRESVSMISHGSCCKSLSEALPPTAFADLFSFVD